MRVRVRVWGVGVVLFCFVVVEQLAMLMNERRAVAQSAKYQAFVNRFEKDRKDQSAYNARMDRLLSDAVTMHAGFDHHPVGVGVGVGGGCECVCVCVCERERVMRVCLSVSL